MASPDTPTHRWLIEVAIEAKSKAEWDRLNTVLAAFGASDPDLGVSSDPASRQIILRGASEKQLDAAISNLRNHDIAVSIGAPQVTYRESITRQVTHEYVHKKQSGGAGQFAGVKLVVGPLPPNSTPSFQFENRIVSDAVPEAFIPGVEKGLESALGSGVLAGFPVTDLKVSLIDGKYHDVDSSALAFEIASRMGLRETLQKAGPVLIEPIMAVEVTTPSDGKAAVVRDLESRGSIQKQEMRGDDAVVHAIARLANLLGYEHALSRLTRDQARVSIRFAHYAPVPSSDDPPFRPAMAMRP
jgi:elongation factor G